MTTFDIALTFTVEAETHEAAAQLAAEIIDTSDPFLWAYIVQEDGESESRVVILTSHMTDAEPEDFDDNADPYEDRSDPDRHHDNIQFERSLDDDDGLSTA